MRAVSIKNSILFLMIMMSSMASAQSIKSTPIDSMMIKPRLKINWKNSVDKSSGLFSLQQLNNQSYSEMLPFFCKMEHKMSLNARIPVRIRLGSLDYVNKLEGKGH